MVQFPIVGPVHRERRWFQYPALQHADDAKDDGSRSRKGIQLPWPS